MQNKWDDKDPKDGKCVLCLRNSRRHSSIGMQDVYTSHMRTIHIFCSLLAILVHLCSLREGEMGMFLISTTNILCFYILAYPMLYFASVPFLTQYLPPEGS